jgi:ADP-ribose pyrophosphatase YjhB (NUDIX family)
MPVIVGGVIEKNGKFLLVQEAQEKCRGKWDIPAGHLESNETVFESAKREVFEETGCKVELTGILEVANKVLSDDIWMGIIFSTKMLEENIKFDTAEILDVKWFTYEEIINMKNELRFYEWIVNGITAYRNNQIADIDFIKIVVQNNKN